MATYTLEAWINNNKQISLEVELDNDQAARAWFDERKESYVEASLWGAGKTVRNMKELASYMKPNGWVLG